MSVVWVLIKLLFLAHVGTYFGICSVWDWTWEPSTTCQHEALPTNQSGIKVLIYGPQKTGTKSMTKALLKLGYGQTYHSEDFLYNLWTGFADEFWRRPENGGAYPFATVWPPAEKGSTYFPTHSDNHVIAGTKPEELATAISRCRIEALAFDGIEELFWHVQAVSPGAKVVSLRWRTWPEYKKSLDNFNFDLLLALFAYFHLLASVHLLPWSIILLPIFEKFSNNSIHEYLSTGGPPFTSGGETMAVRYFRYNTAFRRWVTHVSSGLDLVPQDEEMYNEGFDEVRRRISAEDLFEFDMKKHSAKDLCDFLGFSGPNCQDTKRLPKGVNVLYTEREAPGITLALLPLFLALHWANYKIVGYLWRWCCCRRCCHCRCCTRAKTE